MSDLYNNIKIRRKALGLSQEELAKKMGYTSRSTIAKIESGRNDIPQSKIKAFAEALDTTPTVLLGLSKDEPQDTDALSQKIITLASGLNAAGKQRIIDYMEILTSNSNFSKANTRTIALPIAARGPNGQNHTLSQEEYLEAENTKFDEIKPQKKLPDF